MIKRHTHAHHAPGVFEDQYETENPQHMLTIALTSYVR